MTGDGAAYDGTAKQPRFTHLPLWLSTLRCLGQKQWEVRSTERDHEGLTCVGPEVDGELAGVAAGVGADLAFKGPLVGVYPQVLVEAAAVGRGVVTRLTLVGLHAGVAPHVGLELVLPAEALATDFALVGFVSFKHTHTHRWHQETTGKKKTAYFPLPYGKGNTQSPKSVWKPPSPKLDG